jgi:transcriptional regulator with XRE-family HTH domain
VSEKPCVGNGPFAAFSHIPMKPLASAACFVREQRQMTQRAVAEALGVSFVHVSNIERGRSVPSAALVERYRDVPGVDLHVLSWCLFEEDDQIPTTIREARLKLAQAWRRELASSAFKPVKALFGAEPRP